MRGVLVAYLKIATGSLGRVAVQALYFTLLVNALSLPEYGTFAACSSAAIILSCGGAFGFVAPMFRAATIQRRRLGFYLTAFHVYALAMMPVAAVLGLIAHAAFFDRYIALGPFLAVVFAEVLCTRYVDAIVQVFTALGRFSTASGLSLSIPAGRTAAIGVLWLTGQDGLDSWAWFYLGGNLAAVGLAAALAPRGRFLWRGSILRRRLWQSISYEAVRLAQALGTELDKILIIALTDQRIAGIYALSMRIVDLATVPVKASFPLLVRRLIRRPGDLRDLSLRVAYEVCVCLGGFLLFGAAMLVLSFRPTLLGANIATAYPWFSALTILPAARIAIVYHAELFFAADRLPVYALIAVGLLVAEIAGLWAVIVYLPDFAAWPLMLDVLWAGLYALSLTASLWLLSARRSC